MNKKEMIEKITLARHNDADFFYCIVDIVDINELSNKRLKRMSKKELEVLFKTAIEVLKTEEYWFENDVEHD